MRNPSKSARRWGFVVAVGLACFAAPYLFYDPESESAVPLVLSMIGVTLAVLGGYFLVDALVAGRRLRRLRAGEGLIARWRLTPEEWRAFVHGDRQRNADDPENMNTLTMRKRTPKQGIEVLVGEKELAVDGFVQSMRVGGFASSLEEIEWFAGAPSVILCRFRVPRGRYATAVDTFRIPVAGDARPQGMRVYQHFRGAAEAGRNRVSLAMLNPRLTLWICSALLAICVVAAIWGFANRNDASTAHVIAAVTGVILGLGCLLMIAIVKFESGNARR